MQWNSLKKENNQPTPPHTHTKKKQPGALEVIEEIKMPVVRISSHTVSS